MHRVLVAAALIGPLVLGGAAPAFADDGVPVPTAEPTAAPSPTPSGPVLVAPSSVPVTGTARDGGVLTAAVDGLAWGAPPDAVRVQWLRAGLPVTGATSARYRPGPADVGHRVRVRVTAVLGGQTAVVTSGPRTIEPGVTSERRLRTGLTALLKRLPGEYALQVDELDGGRRQVGIGAARHREPASVYKLFVAYGVFTRIDGGALRYGDRLRSGLTVRTCLRAMIEPSDNYCAQDLLARVGILRLNRLLHGHGLTGTTFWYDGHRTKTTTTADVTRLLDRLAQGRLVSKASTAAFLRLLETHVWREAIPPGLPDGTRQASKPGSLYTSTGFVQTDAAIVWGKRSRYVLTVMGSRGATTGAITRISRLVHRELQGPSGRAFHYDRQQMRATGPLVLTASVFRGSRVLGRWGAGTKVEVIDSIRTRYLVRIHGRTGWIDNTHLTLRHPVL